MKEHDVVKLKTDDKKLGLTTENRGAIVDVLVPGKVFTVEFFDKDHNTIMDSLFTEFTVDQLELVQTYEDVQ